MSTDYSEHVATDADVRALVTSRARAARDIRRDPRHLEAAAAHTGTSLGELGLSVRVENALEESGVNTVEELSTRTQADLRAIPGFGVQCLREIQDAVKRWLSGERQPEPPLPKPVDYQPGSARKFSELVARAERGEALFHPEDGCGQGRPMSADEKPHGPFRPRKPRGMPSPGKPWGRPRKDA